MNRSLLAVLSICAAIQSAAGGELEVAKAALRDGLWQVARAHAAKVEGDEARIVIIESYAREARWREVLATLSSYGAFDRDAAHYYRALALEKTGDRAGALKILAEHRFSEPGYAEVVAALRTQLELAAGDNDQALARAKAANLAAGDADRRMVAASACAATGDRAGAERLWRSVLVDTNAGERAVATAAMQIGDTNSLYLACRRIVHPELRRTVVLRYARALLGDDATFAEGEAIIRRIVHDAPGATGARDAFIALAGALLDRGRCREAAADYRSAIEAWPELGRDAAVREACAWALSKSGEHEAALAEFVRAGECAADDESRARALLEQGQTLSAIGRGEAAMEKFRAVLERYAASEAAKRLKVLLELRDLEAAAREDYRNFRFKEAETKFAELARREPAGAARMEYLQMLCLYGQGRDLSAQAKAQVLAESAADESIRAEATLWLAKFRYNAGQWSESCALFSDYATNRAPHSAHAPSALLWAARAAFAAGAYGDTLGLVTRLVRGHPDAAEFAAALILQGEALVELSRLDEAIVVLERALSAAGAPVEERIRARILRADALFAMGADNPARYREALESYRALQLGEQLAPETRFPLAVKIARTLEKLGRTDEAVDQYYGEVVHAYRDGRRNGEKFGEEVQAAFAGGAFRLADLLISRGEREAAGRVLSLVSLGDIPAAAREARRRLERLQKKGGF